MFMHGFKFILKPLYFNDRNVNKIGSQAVLNIN